MTRAARAQKATALDELPGSARIWIFGAGRRLRSAEVASLLAAVDGFLAEWRAHGVPLRGARDWRCGRFLVVGVDVEAAPPTGCSVDALVGVLRRLEQDMGVRFLGNEAVWYRDAQGAVQAASRAEFRSLAREGCVTPDSVVFDNSVTDLAGLRNGQWEGPARDRWHAAFFG